ncbi:MAG: hypothetical protein QOC64_3008 [Solirubrobacteraceae bacterium]|nr:hypothetical protein [Solirubrobacteraceae bacterium]
MTGSRAEAYGRVMRLLEEIGPTKLLPLEHERVRETADTLLFADDPHADAVAGALLDATALIDHLEHSGRWTTERAERLRGDLRGCGPASDSSEWRRAA